MFSFLEHQMTKKNEGEKNSLYVCFYYLMFSPSMSVTLIGRPYALLRASAIAFAVAAVITSPASAPTTDCRATPASFAK
jgi:hypothetical protein